MKDILKSNVVLNEYKNINFRDEKKGIYCIGQNYFFRCIKCKYFILVMN